MVGGGIYNNAEDIDWGIASTIGGLGGEILRKGLDNPGYRNLFEDMIDKEPNIEVMYSYRVASVDSDTHFLDHGETTRLIKSIKLDYAPFDELGCPPEEATREQDVEIFAKIFIDCSYDGQLMATSGLISYTYGREASSKYEESLAGSQKKGMAVYDIDPYNTPGDKTSGLLPLLLPKDVISAEGEADELTMGYGFRWVYTEDGSGFPIEPSENYDPREFELFRRAFKNDVDVLRGYAIKHKHGSVGTYNEEYAFYHANLMRSLESSTAYGSNMYFPDSSYKIKAQIWKQQQNFVRDFTHFLRTDPSVPEAQREIALRTGLQRGQFDETKGYPHQLYIREARRMISDYVVSEKNLRRTNNLDDPIVIASYGFDEWPYAIIPTSDGKVELHGGYYSNYFFFKEQEDSTYQIPYRSIVPKADECHNLFVPVAISSSHVAMASLRMEPVWMNLGQVAGIAATMAIKKNISVQHVPYAELFKKLEAADIKVEKWK